MLVTHSDVAVDIIPAGFNKFTGLRKRPSAGPHRHRRFPERSPPDRQRRPGVPTGQCIAGTPVGTAGPRAGTWSHWKNSVRHPRRSRSATTATPRRSSRSYFSSAITSNSRAGRLEIIPSTPNPISLSINSRSSTVQTWTLLPPCFARVHETSSPRPRGLRKALPNRPRIRPPGSPHRK